MPSAPSHSFKLKTHPINEVDIKSIIEPSAKDANKFTGSKVLATVGPASQSVETMMQLIEAGVSGFQLELTHYDLKFHTETLQNIQEAMKKSRKLCAVVIETISREVIISPTVINSANVTEVQQMKCKVQAGQRLLLTTRTNVEPDEYTFQVSSKRFAELVLPGDTAIIAPHIIFGDELSSLSVEVEEVVDGVDVICRAAQDAVLEGLMTLFSFNRPSEGGLFLSHLTSDLPLFSEYDKSSLKELSKKFEIDFVSVASVNSGEDIEEARMLLDQFDMKHTKVMARVASREALVNFPSILARADAILLARGALGLELPPEKIAMVQKVAVHMANLSHRPLIITRVVDSMIACPRPTRAEVTDVANAVLDGVDAFLLGGETMTGMHPVAAVNVITATCHQAESVFNSRDYFEELMSEAMALEESDQAAFDQDYVKFAMSPLPGGSPGNSAADLAKLEEMHKRVPRPSPLNRATMGGPVHSCGSMADEQDDGHRVRSRSSAKEYEGGMPNRSKMVPNASVMSFASVADGNAERQDADGHMKPTNRAFLSAGSPHLNKSESIASTAVRAAEKACAAAIIVYTSTGSTALLVAKYRPTVPIIALVIPQITSNSLKWRLEGTYTARQALITRGVIPMLAAPSSSEELVLDRAIVTAARLGFVKPHDSLVVLQRIHKDLCLKIVSVDQLCEGVQRQGARSHTENRSNGYRRMSYLATGSLDMYRSGSLEMYSPDAKAAVRSVMSALKGSMTEKESATLMSAAAGAIEELGIGLAHTPSEAYDPKEIAELLSGLEATGLVNQATS